MGLDFPTRAESVFLDAAGMRDHWYTGKGSEDCLLTGEWVYFSLPKWGDSHLGRKLTLLEGFEALAIMSVAVRLRQ